LRRLTVDAAAGSVTRRKSINCELYTEWWGAGVVICLERSADLHMVQLMPLPLTVSCSSKIQIGFTFQVPAHLGSPGKRAVKRVCVCVCFYLCRWAQVCYASTCVPCFYLCRWAQVCYASTCVPSLHDEIRYVYVLCYV